jgi:hypothetical protein
MRFSALAFRTIQLGLAISITLCWCDLAQAQTTCFGISDADTANVCSGQGTCVALDTCACFDLNVYSGPECEQPVCDGLPSTNPGVCSGQGTCVAPNACVCDDPTSYSGTWCEQPVCYGFLSTDSGVCSGQGTCDAPDTCACFDSDVYTGPECEQPVCFFFASTNPGVCSGQGTCDAPDTCACDVDYTGSNCELGAIAVPVSSSTGLIVFALLMLATGLVTVNRRGARAAP